MWITLFYSEITRLFARFLPGENRVKSGEKPGATFRRARSFVFSSRRPFSPPIIFAQIFANCKDLEALFPWEIWNSARKFALIQAVLPFFLFFPIFFFHRLRKNFFSLFQHFWVLCCFYAHVIHRIIPCCEENFWEKPSGGFLPLTVFLFRGLKKPPAKIPAI